MGMGMFQFGGLASGLDTKAIISAMVNLEKRPITMMQDQKALHKTQKSAFSTLDTKLGDLMDSLDKLRKATTFLEFDATPDEEGYYTVSASSSAKKGSYKIDVDKLAEADRFASNNHIDPDETYGAGGIINITVGSTTTPITIGADAKMADIASAINLQTETTGVSASVINTGSGYRLSVQGGEGSEKAFTMAAGGATSTEVQNMVTELNSNRLGTAADASIKIDGITVTRSSNTITDAIEGVSLTLLKEHENTDTTSFTVTTNATDIGAKINEFISDYNGVIDFMKDQSAVNEDGEAEGSLVGDFTASSIRRQMRAIVGGVANTGNSQFSMLAFAGIESDQDGKLTFTQSEFEEALAEDEQAVKDLFTKEDIGIAYNLYEKVDDFTDIVDGMIKNRTDGLDRLMKDLDRRITDAESRLEKYEENLVKQFAGYEGLISQYQAQGSALSSINTNFSR